MMPKDLSSSTAILPRSDCEALLAASDRPDPQPGPDQAVEIARRLLGVYPRADAEDPEIYFASVAALFGEYPASIGREVARELPRTLKFMPRLAEIREALEERLTRRRAIRWRAEWMLKEHARRDREAAITDADAAHRREVVARLIGGVKSNPELSSS